MDKKQSNPLNKKQKRFLGSFYASLFVTFAALLILL